MNWVESEKMWPQALLMEDSWTSLLLKDCIAFMHLQLNPLYILWVVSHRNFALYQQTTLPLLLSLGHCSAQTFNSNRCWRKVVKRPMSVSAYSSILHPPPRPHPISHCLEVWHCSPWGQLNYRSLLATRTAYFYFSHVCVSALPVTAGHSHHCGLLQKARSAPCYLVAS